MDKLISIIIPVYNVEKYLIRCIESVLNQDYHEIEIILVDDGSTDCSGKLCDEMAQLDNRIRVIHKPNNGLGKARNSGIEIAQGEYLFFIDSDDYIMNNIIHKLYVISIANDADVVCCGYQSGRKKYYLRDTIEILSGQEATKKMFMNDGIDGNAVCKLYKKSLFLNIEYPEGAHETVPVTYKVLLSSKKVVLIEECGYYIEKREGSITRSSFGSNHIMLVQRTKQVYDKMLLENKIFADVAYVWYLNAIIKTFECAQNYKTKNESEEYKIILQTFQNHYYEILRNHDISFRNKVIALLLKLHMYILVKKLVIKG